MTPSGSRILCNLLQNIEICEELEDDACGGVNTDQASDQAENNSENGNACQKANQSSRNRANHNVNDHADHKVCHAVVILKGQGPDFFQKIHGKPPLKSILYSKAGDKEDLATCS